MKKTSAFIVGFFFCSTSVSFAANDTGSKLSYDKGLQQIKSDDGRSFLKFEERDEGNTAYYFDYFGGNSAVVHDSDSLDSYSVFSVIERDNINFKINCIYADFKSGNNGIVSKKGICGLDKIIDNKSSVSGGEGDDFINGIINHNNKIQTSYFMNDKVKYLPIILFQNENRYAYKLYESKSDLENGNYKIISCENNSGACELYGSDAWVVIQNAPNPSIDFDVLKSLNGKSTFEKANATKVNLVAGENSPFEVKSSKAYFQTSAGKKMKSYLVKGDKITLLNLGEDRCLIEYTNAKNKAVDGYISCQDLNLFN
ncbi:hypothetical protein SIL08_04865 [Scandinavium sp. V105_16]|uniref:Uncharacterized protein n=1 Tax=Scandinavium lactucae TaxID=3095028 RepID=A0AAJ2S2V4_9ENTR|nr:MULTISPECIES: hypothetical protein [unclassified Scandinavium]MDX6019624.1 hypothetical protein [Scandinavium sp. V105_16]MDX6032640.1 hypothetical protein [Scandinavium sp. V105_12]